MDKLRKFFRTHKKKSPAVAFIDGQNLHLGTTLADNPWKVDLVRFRTYLKDKYAVSKAFYFVGCYDKKQVKLYEDLTQADFNIVFREHVIKSKSSKKGNVDTDLVFYMLSGFITHEYKKKKIVLVSGDGDYFRTVKFLISKRYFAKILLPSRKNYSRLYNLIPQKYRSFLDDPNIRRKISYKKEGFA